MLLRLPTPTEDNDLSVMHRRERHERHRLRPDRHEGQRRAARPCAALAAAPPQAGRDQAEGPAGVDRRVDRARAVRPARLEGAAAIRHQQEERRAQVTLAARRESGGLSRRSAPSAPRGVAQATPRKWGRYAWAGGRQLPSATPPPPRPAVCFTRVCAVGGGTVSVSVSNQTGGSQLFDILPRIKLSAGAIRPSRKGEQSGG